MDRVPEPSAALDLLKWMAYEHYAAWTAKLAILRADRLDDIAHLGHCLGEHERHALELTRLARMAQPDVRIPTDATCVTRERHVVGAIADGSYMHPAASGSPTGQHGDRTPFAGVVNGVTSVARGTSQLFG
jgi:hypothetical protein